MTYTFKPAVRENVSLIIALAGGTGSGKTYSAMRLATGIAGGKRFAVIDTENGRASHYADQFLFDTCDLRAPFRPDAYAEAIKVADKAGYPVIVVDSASHEHAGEGGLLDWHEEELERMAGSDWQKREACKMAAWIKPKSGHKHMMNVLLQVKAHIILCFRAEEKIEMVKVDGKMQVRAKHSPVGKDGWVPICEKNLPFEATCSFLLLASNPGVPHPIKLQAQHKTFFEDGNVIKEMAGEHLAKWAAGGQAKDDGRNTTKAQVKWPDEVETVEPPDPIMPVMDDSLNMDRRIVFQDHLAMIESATTVAALSNETNAALDNQLLTTEQKAAVRILRDKRMAALQPKKK